MLTASQAEACTALDGSPSTRARDTRTATAFVPAKVPGAGRRNRMASGSTPPSTTPA